MNFLITAPYSLFGDWSAFSLIYSIRKISPDAKIGIKVKKQVSDKHFFKWLNKFNLNKNLFSPLVIESSVMMVRFAEEFSISEAKEDKFTPFVSYKNGCGKFVYSEWIDKEDYPFPYAENFLTQNVCVNEIQIIKTWKQINNLYGGL